MKLADLNVLIIDDVETVRSVLTRSLNKLGIRNIKASDSLLESWKILISGIESNQPIDLILCDWNMPKGDGIELLNKLRSEENKKFSLTKFIMITGSNDKVLQAMDAGAHNVIHKPFNSEIIKNKLELIFDELEGLS